MTSFEAKYPKLLSKRQDVLRALLELTHSRVRKSRARADAQVLKLSLVAEAQRKGLTFLTGVVDRLLPEDDPGREELRKLVDTLREIHYSACEDDDQPPWFLENQ